MNGTSGKSLREGYIKALTALSAALVAASESGPNGRDYYPQGDAAIGSAVAEHRSRLDRLESLRSEFESLAMHCDVSHAA